ncbi:(4Fe-4S)-binding protein [Parabacteroides sp. 52]|uniref:(4Fe-4S)-binding protein n=1 Tax=unclassified Parabacteroides TaxID=2649774 RepID=UPI0013D8A4DA|nr:MULTISPECIES: (4Fe-4S)-binding protein [unclassified Parabacteroides]MDH6535609.1 putative Fe-S cluster protein YjdI [Parabacteroides sp. PM5-20]NDV55474.1 (4Fe-4S)-binding protein [Parabacteroides sp. 52]
MNKKHEYSNGEITIIWQPDLCCHSGICVQTLPRVYSPGKRPWITIENATTNDLIMQIKTCPSGALSYRMNDKE